MKKVKIKRDWQIGEYRYARGFALLPVTITKSKNTNERTFSVSETRWLETVYIMQRYEGYTREGGSPWVNIAFVGEDIYEQNKDF